MFGFLNIDKPKHRTSREAVNAVQRLVKPHRVGHAGTLDPLATGVLVVCVGPATRLTKYVHQMPKTYLADFRLGFESDTEDTFGTVEPVVGAKEVTEDQLSASLPQFVGQIMQLPPKFSALKLNGKRAYELARKGKKVNLDPRPVEIHCLTLEYLQYPDFRIKIVCGSGTYVRSLGRDIGRALGSGAIMTGLERTAIGNFEIQTAISSEELTSELIEQNVVKPQAALGLLPAVEVPDTQVDLFANGHTWSTDQPLEAKEAAAIDQSGRLLTILKQRSPGFFTPAINFSKYWLAEAQKSED